MRIRQFLQGDIGSQKLKDRDGCLLEYFLILQPGDEENDDLSQHTCSLDLLLLFASKRHHFLLLVVEQKQLHRGVVRRKRVRTS